MATNELYIFGAGGHGKVVAEAAIAAGWRIAGFVDRAPNGPVLDLPVIEEGLFLERSGETNVALGVGANGIRMQLLETLLGLGMSVRSIIHPAATLSPSAQIGTGTVVMAGVVINADARIGQGAIINTGAIIEHDNRIGDGTHVSPGAALAGNVTVGREVHIGIGASVIQGVVIGDQSIVGAGAAVIRDVPPGVTVVGVPAREIR